MGRLGRSWNWIVLCLVTAVAPPIFVLCVFLLLAVTEQGFSYLPLSTVPFYLSAAYIIGGVPSLVHAGAILLIRRSRHAWCRILLSALVGSALAFLAVVILFGFGDFHAALMVAAVAVAPAVSCMLIIDGLAARMGIQPSDEVM